MRTIRSGNTGIKTRLPSIVVICISLLLGGAVRAHSAPHDQTGSGGSSQTSPQPAPAPPSAELDIHGPSGMVGWTYSSIIRNGVTAGIIFSRGKAVPVRWTWRGLQLSGTAGSRGMELGGGWARMALAAQFPVGYGFRGVVGRVWKDSGRLIDRDWYAGGEAAVTFLMIRLTGGLVVPVGTGLSHKPIFTGSVGLVFPLAPFKQMSERERAAREKVTK